LIDTQERTQSRKTTLVVAAVLGLLAAWNVYRGRMIRAEIMGAVAAVLAVTGFFLPELAVRFHRGWMKLGGALGYVNSRILLTIVYFLVITPFGWIRKLMGSDPLLRRQTREDGYWHRRPIQRQAKEQFERAF
jgi:multisubunit Na+/H+ antiporter MnhG subunit